MLSKSKLRHLLPIALVAAIVAVAAVVILSLAARVGVPAVWRDGPTAGKSSLDEAASAVQEAPGPRVELHRTQLAR